jgi:hypothetical protein
MTVQPQPVGLASTGACAFGWMLTVTQTLALVNEGSITENVGPGKARARHGDYRLKWFRGRELREKRQSLSI